MKAEPKIKRYRLGISQRFLKGHPRAGEETFFVGKIQKALGCPDCERRDCHWCMRKTRTPKIHTIRGNYSLWKKRMAEVQEGRAVIELYYWQGKPYNSNQIVFAELDKDSGCGLQELSFINNEFQRPCVFGSGYAVRNTINELAKNDSLQIEDFKAWFKGYDLSKPMAIIHFTKLRY